MTLTTPDIQNTVPIIDPAGLAQIEQMVAALDAEIRSATGASRASILLHAHGVPADRYHQIDVPIIVHHNGPDGAVNMTSKQIGALSLHCEHRTIPDVPYPHDQIVCPDLTAAIDRESCPLCGKPSPGATVHMECADREAFLADRADRPQDVFAGKTVDAWLR